MGWRDREKKRGSLDVEIKGLRDLRLIGHGGFSRVYQGWDGLDRQVAVKVLSVELSPRAEERFKLECKVNAQLGQHDSIVTVYDAGVTQDRRPYLIMEYCRRGSLADLLEHGPLPLGEALAITAKVAGALGYAHSSGIIHNDVKPQNVLMTDFGPRLADFGIAAIADAQRETQTVLFSPVHAAPEVIDGRQPTPSSDLYSLGSTLFELLAGRAPFDDPADAALFALRRRKLEAPIGPLGAEVPGPVVELIQRTQDPNASGRPQSAAEFLEQLQRVAHVLGIQLEGATAAIGPAPAHGPTTQVAAGSPTDPDVRRWAPPNAAAGPSSGPDAASTAPTGPPPVDPVSSSPPLRQPANETLAVPRARGAGSSTPPSSPPPGAGASDPPPNSPTGGLGASGFGGPGRRGAPQDQTRAVKRRRVPPPGPSETPRAVGRSRFSVILAVSVGVVVVALAAVVAVNVWGGPGGTSPKAPVASPGAKDDTGSFEQVVAELAKSGYGLNACPDADPEPMTVTEDELDASTGSPTGLVLSEEGGDYSLGWDIEGGSGQTISQVLITCGERATPFPLALLIGKSEWELAGASLDSDGLYCLTVQVWEPEKNTAPTAGPQWACTDGVEFGE